MKGLAGLRQRLADPDPDGPLEPAGDDRPEPDPDRLIPTRPARRWDLRSGLFRLREALVLTACLLLIGLGVTRGLRTPQAVTKVVPVETFDQASGAFAERVVRVFYTWDQARPDDHRAAVAQLVASPSDPQLGWDGRGVSTVEQANAVAVSAPVDNVVIVTVLATISGTPRTVFVPVLKTAAGPVFGSIPSLGSAPLAGRITDPRRTAGTDVDDAASDDAAPIVAGFLRAWGAGSRDVDLYTAEGFTAPTSPGALRVFGEPVVAVPHGGATRAALVLVRWSDSQGRTLPSAYTITLVRSPGAQAAGSSRWRVAGITPAPSSSFDDLPRSPA